MSKLRIVTDRYTRKPTGRVSERSDDKTSEEYTRVRVYPDAPTRLAET
jgi:hypothetical protein